MDILQEARQVLEVEGNAVLALKECLGKDFISAVELISSCKGKLILTGMGKSGQVARKLSSTFSSTGTPSFYLHPSESSHGDLGVVTRSDIVVALSFGGESTEFNDVLSYATRKAIPIIALTGRRQSSLGRAATFCIEIPVKTEACPLGLAPTASSTATLAMGDALAMCVLRSKGFHEADFAELHPGGSLGRRLLTRVKDIMHVGDALPFVMPITSIREVLWVMSHREVRGTAGVVDGENNLIGVITDGDIRRMLEKNPISIEGNASDIMSKSPKTIDCNELAEKAALKMEAHGIQLLFVIDMNSPQPTRPVGIIHLHDLLLNKII